MFSVCVLVACVAELEGRCANAFPKMISEVPIVNVNVNVNGSSDLVDCGRSADWQRSVVLERVCSAMRSSDCV